VRALVVVVMLARIAAADPTQDRADKLFEEGRDLLKQGDSKGACEKFESAIKLDPRATGTMLNLGLCYENLGKLGTSLKWFRRAQAAAAEQGQHAEVESAAKKHTLELAERVPWFSIDVAAPPPGMEARVDGLKIEATDYARVEVDPGHHDVELRAKHKTPIHIPFDIKERETKPLAVPLFVDAPPVYVDRGAPRRRMAYLVGGIGGGFLIGTGVYGLIEHSINSSARHDAEPVCNMALMTFDADKCTSDRKRAQASIDRLKYIGTSAFVAGAVGLAVGIGLYVSAPGKERIEDASLVPYVAPDGAGVAISGRF